MGVGSCRGIHCERSFVWLLYRRAGMMTREQVYCVLCYHCIEVACGFQQMQDVVKGSSCFAVP